MNSIRNFTAQFLIASLSLLPLSLARGLGSAIGLLSWLLKDRNARVTLDNLTRCYPHLSTAEREALAKRSLRETYKTAAETFIVWRRGREWCARHIVGTEGEEILLEALASEKGVLLAVPHLGNWEFLGSRLAKYAISTCMYRPLKNPFMEALVLNGRSGLEMIMVPANRKGVSLQLKALNAGKMVAILPDQVPSEGGVFSPFFNQQAYTMTLIHGFVQRTGCRVVMGIAQREKGGFRIHFTDPPNGIYSDSESESVEGLNKAVEECVAICPEQYQWEYKRFRKPWKGKGNKA